MATHALAIRSLNDLEPWFVDLAREESLRSGGPTQIKDRLYLGDVFQATSAELLRNLGITHVVNCTPDVPNVLEDADVRYHRVAVEDDEDADIAAAFDEAADFVADALAERTSRVLIHCIAGISRSATITLAYLVKHERARLSEAFAYVRERRGAVRPNDAFYRALCAYEASLAPSASPSPIPDVYRDALAP